MNDIASLEGRLSAALERLQRGLENYAGNGAADENLAALSLQLEDEKTANAQLEERVRALKEKQDEIGPMAAKVSEQSAQLAGLDGELQRLRASNADLRQVAGQLRAAAEGSVADAELINRALMAEVEALQAQRSADRKELDAILSELKPLVEGA